MLGGKPGVFRGKITGQRVLPACQPPRLTSPSRLWAPFLHTRPSHMMAIKVLDQRRSPQSVGLRGRGQGGRLIGVIELGNMTDPVEVGRQRVRRWLDARGRPALRRGSADRCVAWTVRRTGCHRRAASRAMIQ
jgi:hypothetical protein